MSPDVQPSNSSFIRASERDAREWREVLAAAGQYLSAQLTPVQEGYASLPEDAQGWLILALSNLDSFDRAMAKIDGKPGGVGGKYVLERVEGGV